MWRKKNMQREAQRGVNTANVIIKTSRLYTIQSQYFKGLT